MQRAFLAWAPLLAALVMLALPALARAQSPDDEAAHTHFESGRLHFDEGDYDAALHEFQVAYELSHREGLRFNLYLVEERLNHLEEAATHLEAYLATDLVSAEDRPTLERRLVNLRERIAAAEASQASTSSAPATSTAPAEHPLFVPGIVTLAAGGAGLIVFAILGGLALSEDSRLASTCSPNCARSDVDGLRTLSIGADVALSIGLVAAAAGAALLLVDAMTGTSSTSGSAALRITPFASADAGGLFVGGAL
ncbi:MAG: hypothetical protein U0234_20390 [Sandaracinus sp.]